MRSRVVVLPFLAILLVSCARKESAEAPPASTEMPSPTADTAPTTAAEPGPRAFIHLKNGTKVPGTIVASSRTDMVLAGDDGIERKIPLGQIKSVEYSDAEAAPLTPLPPLDAGRPKTATRAEPTPRTQPAEPRTNPAPAGERAAATKAAPEPPPVTTRTYELPAGSEISVRTNEPIDSETARAGQTFDAQVTRDATDVNGDVVIPRRSSARVVIRSASNGGRISGASDLVLDLQSVVINGKTYNIDTADVTRSGKAGVGTNRRTAEYTGGGAALGAIIGAIAGGGKGAAIGAGAGAGAGALAQILTKGKAIKVPVESVLTFKLDKPLRVNRAE